MAGNSTKEALANALRELMELKPIDRITIKDLVEKCGVNRQTFYYHFDDVYDLLEWIFEQDADKVLPKTIVYERWREDVLCFFEYLYNNRDFALNVYNSNSRLYMLKFYKERLEWCIRSFAEIVSEDVEISRADFDFVIEFYAQGIVGLIAQWLDLGMVLPKSITKERFIKLLDNSVENMLERFKMG